MKKLLLATLGAFFVSAGIAFAGGFGGCSGSYHSKKELTSLPTSNSIVLVEIKDKRVELADASTEAKRYNVTTTKGESLAINLSKEDLSMQYPELFKALEG